MLRNSLLYLSNQPSIFKFVRNNRMARGFANRFVAGETLDTAVAAVKKLNAAGMTVSLDLLGESVNNEAEARSAGKEYLAILDCIHSEKLDANVSVKLTAMGLDISEELCVDVMHSVLQRASEYRTFVRLDMEGSDYTQKTLDLFEQHLYPAHRENVGVVLQSYLYRTAADVEHVNMIRARVRLCKGAYKEPEKVAFPDKKDVDASYVRCMKLLMTNGNYPGLATHDERIIEQAKTFAKASRITPDKFEFQMLYGVRRDLQEQLVREGYRLRVYVPFGTQWYPYLMRRLAERPANIAFLTGNVMREMIGSRRH